MVAQLRVNQIHVDLLLSHIPLLRHFGQCSCQVDDCVAAVVFGEEENGEVLALFLGIAIGVCSLWRGVGRGVGAEVGCAEGEGGLAAWAKVGFEGVPDAGVGLGQVVLKRTYTMSVHGLQMRMC